jgi:hypothetical protein
LLGKISFGASTGTASFFSSTAFLSSFLVVFSPGLAVILTTFYNGFSVSSFFSGSTDLVSFFEAFNLSAIASFNFVFVSLDSVFSVLITSVFFYVEASV